MRNFKFKFMSKLIIPMLNGLCGGKFRNSHVLQTQTITESNIFGKNSDFDVNKFYQLWSEAFKQDGLGYFAEACKLRIEVLSRISDIQFADFNYEKNRSPNFMSYGWVHAIGHLGHLGAFRIAQQINLIENNPRQILVKTKEDTTNLKMLFGKHFQPLQFKYGISLFENPVNWHNLEHMLMLRTKSGFMSLYELSDLAFGHQDYDPKIHKLNLDENYVNLAQKLLLQRGVPASSWFVALHIREKSNKLDARQASVNSFIPAIKEITKRGGWVIRFGTDNMTPLPDLPNLIDLYVNSPENRLIHYFLLAKAKFLLGNLSGPMEIAKAFGTPVLTTNMIGIGKAMFNAPNGSLFLPKQWIKNSKRVSYEKLICSPEGFSQMNLKHRSKLGYQLLENSETEIKDAVVDFFDQNFHKVDEETIKLDNLRKHHRVIANGRIAPSYLKENKNWFLKTE